MPAQRRFELNSDRGIHRHLGAAVEMVRSAAATSYPAIEEQALDGTDLAVLRTNAQALQVVRRAEYYVFPRGVVV